MPLTQDDFVRRLVAIQGALRGFILAHVQDLNLAEDVLQEVSVALWKKLESYDSKRPFLNWALGIARYEVLHSKRDSARSRVIFDEDLIQKVAERYVELEPDLEKRRLALRHCLGKLPEHYREVVHERYVEARPVGEVARRLERSEGAVHMLLSRIRAALLDCAGRFLADASTKVGS
ncbi:MAG TPA: sigma-70 family RNA polymerase sigma factor [Planctomycetota bacterium]|nr:sigma-70 family RNA polymerase sigma factor [Planctomycetota bacterium]